MSGTIKYEVDNDGIALLCIDVEDKPMNVLTQAFVTELAEHVEKVAIDDNVKGAVITSGKSTFMAGADLKGLLETLEGGLSPQDAYELVRPYSQTLRRLETCGKPFAAAINGTALGGGFELALACHYRVLVDDGKAIVGLPEVTVGLLPGAGGTQRLPRLIGIRDALLLMTEGRHVKPRDALEHGMVDELAAADDLIGRAKRWLKEEGSVKQPWDREGFRVPGGAGAMDPRSVQTFMVGTALVAGKTYHNYPAPIAIMSCVYEGTIVPMDTALRIESKYFARLLADPVSRNMIRTLFVNKGAADKLTRRPKGVDRKKIGKLGILGAGMMGSGIAYVSARAGIDVVLLDTSTEAAERGKRYSEKLLAKRIERGRMTREAADGLLARITPTTDYADLTGCDLVIEAVFEDRGIKAGVTQKAEAVIPATSIFASNTSTLPITGLAHASKRPASFIGIHFFSPVEKMPLVEIIMGEETSDEAIARSLDYVQQITKTPIVVNDSRGFYTSRCFGTFTNEGITMLAEGIRPALIENAAKMAGMPVGPLAVLDEVSIELAHKVSRQSQSDLGEDYVPASGYPVIAKFVEELNRKGKRHGKGFYEYPEDGRKHLWPGLSQHYPPKAEQPPVDAIEKRLLYIQALESARCLEEGVITNPADADIGSVFGWGFPAYTGGTLSFIDTVGIEAFVAECDRLAEAHGARFAVSDWLRNRAERGVKFYPGAAAEKHKAA